MFAPPTFDVLPRGRTSLYESRRAAGIAGARSLRNVPWINVADDGVQVMHAWRVEMEDRDGQVVSVIDARNWTVHRGTAAKRQSVIDGLTEADGTLIRVITLEGEPGHHKGTRYDDWAEWLVQDTGAQFLLWRGRISIDVDPRIPKTPAAFGHLRPRRKKRVSNSIERSSEVRRRTLERAGHKCEIPGCTDSQDFKGPDVHHITHLGHRGTDHTNNTIALCPACHARVHRGVGPVRRSLAKLVSEIRNRRTDACMT